jgi:hypothetical protein
MKLTHPFITRSHDLNGLFKNVKTLSQFMKRLEKQSKMFPERYPIEKYLGDGWEFFCEALIKSHPCDNRIGISEYVPVTKNDNGVDGYGVNIFGEVCAVQPKYRSNTKGLLTSTTDKLDSFITEALLEKNIQPSKQYRHFVFTTAKGLHHYTDHEKYRGKVKCFGYDEIRSLVDNNLHFWNFIREEVLQFEEKVLSLMSNKK